VGILENFEFRGSYYVYGGTGGGRIPLLLLRYQPSYASDALIRSSGGDLSATRDRLEAHWSAELQTDRPFDARFYSDVIRARHGPLHDLATVVGLIEGLAALITLLGLLSMDVHYVQTCTKEVDIRKAMGATVSSLVVLLSRQFLGLIGVAIVATLPLAWGLNQQWFQCLPDPVSAGSSVCRIQCLADPVSVGSGGRAGALGALLLLSLLTVGS